MKVVLQDGIKDCGVCCLLSIIRFYGGEVSKEYLRELTNTTKEGVTLYHLLYAAKYLGFDASGQSGNLEDIKVDNLPCIVHFRIRKNYQHFVVLYKIQFQKNQVIIMDPAKGKRVLSFAEFHMMSSNHYLFLHPNKKLPFLKKKNIILKNVKRLFHKHRKIMMIFSILTIHSFLFHILSSFHFKYLLEYSIQYKVYHNLFIISFMIAGLYFFKNISDHFKNILFNKWNCFFQSEISTLAYEQILLLPYYYFKNRTTGEVVLRFRDITIILDYISEFICFFATDFITLIIFLWIMMKYSLPLTLLVNGYLILVFFLLLFSIPRKKKLYRSLKNHEDVIQSYIIQGISNVDTIKGSHMEKRFIDKFRYNYTSYQDFLYHYSRFLESENFVKKVSLDFLYVLLYGFGSYYVIHGDLSLGTLIVFQTFIRYYLDSFFHLLKMFHNYSNFKISLNRIEELFLLDSEYFKNHYFYLSYQLDGDIEIKKLNYSVGTHVLFQDLSFSIKRGEKVLLYGDSGCGKSTLMKMIMRYIEVEYGKISISNIDINHYHLENIRSNITYVTANEFLFYDTIKNNILLYQEYLEEDFLEVCHLCQVDEIVQYQERGYDVMIEENGFNLSNGERQRIVLARSLIKRSNIYIFDEAFGQIDIEREKEILNKMFQFLKDKTVIVISHRFNNLEMYNRVLKLEEGIIIEKENL